MNFLVRVKLSSHIAVSLSAPNRCFFRIKPAHALQQQFNFFATRAVHGGEKAQQLTKPKAQKSSEPSTTFSQRVKKQVEALAPVWPKPREIPFQAKVANFVNLIGFVKIPVQFETDSDGKHFATTVISAGKVGGSSSLVIPILFEGDLAHTVACHVKKNDCVFVSGQLSTEPLGLALSDGLGKFHVVAENLNFVEGYQKVVDASFSGVGIGKNVDAKKIEEVVEVIDEDDQQLRKKAYENVKGGKVSSDSVISNINASSTADTETPPNRGGGVEVKLETDSGNSSGQQNSSKKKSGEEVQNLWRDLVRSPLQWWDYREHKAKGLVKEKFPDFKQKMTGESLWMSSAPQWVLPGIKMLEFDVKEMKSSQPQQAHGGGEGFSGPKKDTNSEEIWMSLVENPEQWWDNRTGKKNPKSPDFKHKETGKALWLTYAPESVMSKLPPKKEKQGSW